MRRLIRWALLAALIVLVLPVLHEFAVQNQLYDNPTGSLSDVLGYVRTIGDIVRAREAIQTELEKVDRQRDHASASLLAEVNSLMLDLRKAGIPVPFAPKGTEVEQWLEMASVYFSHVGPLLRDGHRREARGVAELVQMRLGSA